MIVVADSTPIIALARIGHLNLLKSVHGTLIVPNAVYQELVKAGEHKSGVKEIREAEWIIVETVKNSLAVQLLNERIDLGESEAIALAIEKKASLLLIDEAKGRKIAEGQGLVIVGTVGTLLTAKNDGLIPRLKPLLDTLMEDGFRLSKKLYNGLLASVNEEG